MLSGAIVVAGRWSDGKPVNARIIVGVVTLVVILAAMPDKLAQPFATLILIAALFTYGLPLAQRIAK